MRICRACNAENTDEEEICVYCSGTLGDSISSRHKGQRPAVSVVNPHMWPWEIKVLVCVVLVVVCLYVYSTRTSPESRYNSYLNHLRRKYPCPGLSTFGRKMHDSITCLTCDNTGIHKSAVQDEERIKLIELDRSRQPDTLGYAGYD